MRAALFTARQMVELIANFRANQSGLDEVDHKPVIKLFTPDAQATWLLSEFDPCEELFFGLCDLGHGTPELGYVSLQDLQQLRGAMGLPIERDLHFEADKTLSDYAAEARKCGYVQA